MALKYKYNNSDRKLTLDEVLDLLVEDKILDSTQAEFVKKKKKLSQKHPLVSIYECEITDRRKAGHHIGMEDLVKWLSEKSEIDYYYIDPLKIDISTVTSVLPKAYIKRLGVLPVMVDEESVTFATGEPYNLAWVREVERIIKKKINLVLSNPNMIANCIDDFYAVHTAVKNVSRRDGIGGKDSTRLREVEKMLGQNGQLDARDESGISGIVDWLFQYAHDERATDIYIEPKTGQGIIRFRIDGMLRVVYKFDPEILLSVLSRLKILAGMKVDEKRKPQDGRIKRRLDENTVIEIRSSCIPTHYGEKVVMRIFDPKMADKPIDDIGFEKTDLDKWKDIAESSFGLVLVTGPTGSGKSTTLHATLRHITKPEINICTAEDPIEIINDEFNQMQINEEAGITFASAIRAFLRQDPDVIMVGEIRDEETSEMAIQASLTGHTVFSTLHTNDALSTIFRLIELGIPTHLLIATLKGICAQRLVRVLCPSCKEKVEIPDQVWKKVSHPYNFKKPSHVFTATGCNECKNTGYRGRICVYEMVFITDKLKEAIQSGVDLNQLQKMTASMYIPIRIHALKKVAEGVTSMEEIMRVVL
jgi:general secretion pathway protein E